MNYYGAGPPEKTPLYPSANYPGAASYGLPQPSRMGLGPQQSPGLSLGPQPTQGLGPQSLTGQPNGHYQPGAMTIGLPSNAAAHAFSPVPTSQSYIPYPAGMTAAQSMYGQTSYTTPSGYHGMSRMPSGMSAMNSMGSYYSAAYTTLPYSTLQPIPTATPSIPSIASLPSVPAVPQIPSIQPSQGGYPAGARQYPQTYLGDPLAAKQPSNPMLPGTSPSLQGVPQGYPAGTGMSHPLGYPSSAMATNPYQSMTGLRMSPQAGPPYGQGF